MHVFVSEYLSTGVLDPLPPSLAREGLAMLLAVLADFGECPGVEVVTAVAPGLVERVERDVPWAQVFSITDPAFDERTFRDLAGGCDAGLVIAPEFDDLLASRIEWLAEAGCRHLGSTAEAVRIAGDKAWLPTFWQMAGLPTPDTRLTGDGAGPFPFPVVVKPRFGAGAQDTFVVRSEEDYRRVVAPGRLVQPYVPGLPASVSFLVGPNGPLALPAATQEVLDDGGPVSYHGGRVPLPCPAGVVDLARRAVEAVPGLLGYIGVDFVLGDQPTLLEINPRLTTSYVGLRRLVRGNLMQRLLAVLAGDPVPPLELNPGSVAFRPDGSVVESG